MNRLQKKYQDEIVPVLQKEFNLKNKLAVSKVTKAVVNVGIGDISQDKGKRAKAIKTLSLICGQEPKKTLAKKAISEFRLRKGNIVGLKVTLRRERMYQFLDKLFNIVLPRIRDFQGVKLSAFDQQANYNLGLSEQIVFPEVDYDTIDQIRGLEINIVTNNDDKKMAKKLLTMMGVPFERTQGKPFERIQGKPFERTQGKPFEKKDNK